jgi:hypothetical protein
LIYTPADRSGASSTVCATSSTSEMQCDEVKCNEA